MTSCEHNLPNTINNVDTFRCVDNKRFEFTFIRKK